MNQHLADLLRKKQKQSEVADGIDWDHRRNRYIADVTNLYDQIETMLSEPIKRKSVALQRRPKQLTENYIGTYSVDDLILLIGKEQVLFSPRGRNIAGASGRVDVVGERGEVALVVQSDSRWGFVQMRQPKRLIVNFNESTLADVLQLVMRD
jgi:hypothetical protein